MYGFSVLFCFMCFWYVVKSDVLCYLIVLFYVGKCFIVNINVNTSSVAHAFKIPSVLGRSYEFWNVCSRIMDHTYNYPFSKCFYPKLNETAIHLEEKPLVIWGMKEVEICFAFWAYQLTIKVQWSLNMLDWGDVLLHPHAFQLIQPSLWGDKFSRIGKHHEGEMAVMGL